jgi:formamidopyrimidine-DNA glycosylase
MPELPEVETVATQLAPLLQGRRVVRVEVLDPKLALHDGESAVGRVIGQVRRLGKQVVIELRAQPDSQITAEKAGPLWMAVHLRMTGRLVWIPDAEPAACSHLRARLTLDQGFLLFRDARRFGTMRLVGSMECLCPAGLEPMCGDFTPGALTGLLAGSRQELKPWLLRQDRLVGLGNIYASEILFSARLDPFRLAGSLDAAEARRLHGAVRRVLKLGIECGGTTFSDFQDANGESGRFQKKLSVYGRGGEPCKRCGAPVERVVQQGRSTFYCPKCQG